MPARLTPNQKDRLIDLARRSRRSTSGFYGAFAAGTAEGAWVDLRNIGGRATLDTLVSKGYVERRDEIGPRGASHPFYRPTLAGWGLLARQEKPRDPSPAALVTPDPLCRNCGAPDSWHSEVDGQCPDDDGPHYDSVAAYDAREADVWIRLHDANLSAPGGTGDMSERSETPKLPALGSKVLPIPYAVAMAPREERAANEESRARIAEALGELDEAVCASFRDAPATLAPKSLWRFLATR